MAKFGITELGTMHYFLSLEVVQFIGAILFLKKKKEKKEYVQEILGRFFK